MAKRTRYQATHEEISASVLERLANPPQCKTCGCGLESDVSIKRGECVFCRARG